MKRQSEDHELLIKIARILATVSVDKLTTIEKRIMELLQGRGFLVVQENKMVTD